MSELDTRIAVIGLAVRLPGAEDAVDLTHFLGRDGVEVGEVPPSRWARELYRGEGPHQGTHHRGAFLVDPFSFDHEAFGMTAEDAVFLDPQQRVMLEVGARALEDAGYLGVRRRLDAGVFVGARMNGYGFDRGRGQVPPGTAGSPAEAGPAALWGRSQNFTAAWLSDRFDLAGPSLVVDTACSSSLSAVWLACQSLAAGTCELALVGAVDLLIDPLTFVLLSRTGALSPDGLCHTFDGRANGYVPGEGAAALVLKPMPAALADGDVILGAISGTAVNNDGRTMGVTTPNLEAQIDLLDKAYRTIDPATVQYVEAHGTGTAIGDPIEVRALTEVFTRHGVPRNSVALGSVKRRIGHLHSASGLAGLAKIIVALREGTVPAVAVASPNPRLNLADSPFHLPGTSLPWPEAPVRRAAVSGFGFGGTNAHVVVEAAPAAAPAGPADGDPRQPRPEPVHLLPLSADSPYALRELAAQWLEFLPSLTDGPGGLGDACATARLARPHRTERLAVVGADAGRLAAALRAWLLAPATPHPRTDGTPRTTVSVRPGADAAPPAWLTALDASSPAVHAVVGLFETATGTPLAAFSGELLRILSAVALAIALRDLGLSEDAVDLPPGWEAVGNFVRGRVPLERALADVLRGAQDPSRPTRDTDTGGRAGIDAATLLAGARDGREVAEVLAGIAARLFREGRDVDWAAYQQTTGAAWTKRLLPHAQQRGRALNLAEPLRSAEPGSPAELVSDEGAAGYTYARVFGPAEAPIAQHAVYRTLMLPGVAWFDFLREGAALRGDAFHGARDILFHRPLIATGARRVVCRVHGDGGFRVEDGESGEPYVTGRLVTEPPAAPPPPVPVHTLLADCARTTLHAGSGLYRWLRRIGYHHGRYYRNISWVASLPDGGTLARIEGARQREMNPPGVELFPGLLDSVTVAAIDPANPVFGATDASAFIPLSAGRLDVLGPLDTAAYVRTEIAFWNDEACRVTQTVTDEAGTPLLVFGDMSSKRVPVLAFTAGETSTATAPSAPSAPSAVPSAAPSAVPSASEARPTTPQPPVPVPTPPRPAAPAAPPASRSARALAWFLSLTDTPAEDADKEFLSAGFDSVGLVGLSERISQEHGVSLYPTVFFEYPTPRQFAEFLVEEEPGLVDGLAAPAAPAQEAAPHAEPAPEPTAPAPAEPVPPARAAATATPREPEPARTPEPPAAAPESRPRDVAVVGAAVRLPTAGDLTAFAELLMEGRDTVRPLPEGRRPDADGPVPYASFLDRVDEFDPAPFRISAREAPLIDPQARIVYETIWEALEDGGRNGTRAQGRTGLWIAYSHDHYHEERVRHGVPDGRGLGLEAMIANRLSYLMDWHGPSGLVNTLCSSSLVALHSALQHLRTGDIDTAVIGAVHAGISPEYFHSMGDLMALSPRYRSRAFDSTADGFVPGEGAVAVVLRRYDDAVRDGDRIRGVVKGAAVNHGGRTSRYSAPSPRAQADVISAALRDAAVPVESIGLVEAHGTGTGLGDPIEVEGLTRAWRGLTDRSQFCALSSLKSNVGHLEPAAGLAGLVKVLLAMEHGVVPPSLHVVRPNDHIRFEESPFYLADRAMEWPRGESPRRAAVSAFGMGGVNAHVIVEEPPAAAPREVAGQDSYVVRVTAADETALRTLAGSYADELLGASAETLGDFAHTANTGRAGHRFRAAVRGADAGELAAGLRSVADGRVPASRTGGVTAPNVFLFTGQGSQYAGMGRGLYTSEPVFRSALDECAALLAPHLDVPLPELLFGSAVDALDRTRYAQVGIVSLQVALVRWLESVGVRPDAVAGHSLGELTAAWVAGVLGLEDLLRLTTLRGRLMEEQPGHGAMAVVHADAEAVVAALAGHPGVEVAAYNSPRAVTISGPAAAVAAFREGSGLRTTPLVVSHAFHSELMAGAVAPFTQAVAATPLSAPALPFASSVSGAWHTPESATDPAYWGRAIREPVRFSEAVGTLGGLGAGAVWEIGSHPQLTALAKLSWTGSQPVWLSTLRRERTDQAELHAAVAAYVNGTPADLDWSGLHAGRGQRTITIPTYPFTRQRFWISADPHATSTTTNNQNETKRHHNHV
ncbi:beta-ketoacyl synthase N-terminal-like domain-containing protein [Streptomyces sp. NPDC090077]|uniref:beta-ketoacyl synthase N-terminal-like domain-containing protein n=1 Tax=Streptomyces sp. NPDC090077 TaxID=3365938 RepID=UPI00381636DA